MSPRPLGSSPERRWAALSTPGGRLLGRLSRFPCADAHVVAGLAHGLDAGVEGHDVSAIAAKRERGGDGLDGAEAVALDAGDLDETPDGVAGHAEVMLEVDLRGVLDLGVGAAERGTEAGGGHGRGRADFALAADIGPRDRGVGLDDASDRGRDQQEVADAAVGRADAVVPVVADDGEQPSFSAYSASSRSTSVFRPPAPWVRCWLPALPKPELREQFRSGCWCRNVLRAVSHAERMELQPSWIGWASVNLRTSAITSASTAASLLAPDAASASTIFRTSSPTLANSASPKPRVVPAEVPRRMPEVANGVHGSKGWRSCCR